MVAVVTIDFDAAPDFGRLRLTKIKLWKESPRLVLISCEVDGKETEHGVRMDIDKKAILDDVDGFPDLAASLREGAVPVWEALVVTLARHIQKGVP